MHSTYLALASHTHLAPRCDLSAGTMRTTRHNCPRHHMHGHETVLPTVRDLIAKHSNCLRAETIHACPEPCHRHQGHHSCCVHNARLQMRRTTSRLLATEHMWQRTCPRMLPMHPLRHITKLSRSETLLLRTPQPKRRRRELIRFIKNVAIGTLHAHCRSIRHEKLTEQLQD